MSEHAKRTAPSWVPSKTTRKAVAAAVVTLAAYLVGVFPADVSLFAGFAQLSGLDWLGAVLFLGGSYGLTYAVSNVPSRTTPGA